MRIRTRREIVGEGRKARLCQGDLARCGVDSIGHRDTIDCWHRDVRRDAVGQRVRHVCIGGRHLADDSRRQRLVLGIAERVGRVGKRAREYAICLTENRRLVVVIEVLAGSVRSSCGECARVDRTRSVIYDGGGAGGGFGSCWGIRDGDHTGVTDRDILVGQSGL